MLKNLLSKLQKQNEDDIEAKEGLVAQEEEEEGTLENIDEEDEEIVDSVLSLRDEEEGEVEEQVGEAEARGRSPYRQNTLGTGSGPSLVFKSKREKEEAGEGGDTQANISRDSIENVRVDDTGGRKTKERRRAGEKEEEKRLYNKIVEWLLFFFRNFEVTSISAIITSFLFFVLIFTLGFRHGHAEAHHNPAPSWVGRLAAAIQLHLFAATLSFLIVPRSLLYTSILFFGSIYSIFFSYGADEIATMGAISRTFPVIFFTVGALYFVAPRFNLRDRMDLTSFELRAFISSLSLAELEETEKRTLLRASSSFESIRSEGDEEQEEEEEEEELIPSLLPTPRSSKTTTTQEKTRVGQQTNREGAGAGAGEEAVGEREGAGEGAGGERGEGRTVTAGRQRAPLSAWGVSSSFSLRRSPSPNSFSFLFLLTKARSKVLDLIHNHFVYWFIAFFIGLHYRFGPRVLATDRSFEKWEGTDILAITLAFITVFAFYAYHCHALWNRKQKGAWVSLAGPLFIALLFFVFVSLLVGTMKTTMTTEDEYDEYDVGSESGSSIPHASFHLRPLYWSAFLLPITRLRTKISMGCQGFLLGVHIDDLVRGGLTCVWSPLPGCISPYDS